MDTLTFRTLVALRAGPADGNAILAALRRDDADALPSLPTLYRCLRAALHQGWIDHQEAAGDPGPGRPPKLYRLQPAGREALDAAARRHLELAELVLGDDAAGRAESRS